MKTNENLRESEMNEKDFSLYLMKKEDLKEVFCELIKGLLDGVEKPRKEEEDTFLSTYQAMQMLGRSRPTLWRWEKDGYLVPVRQSGKPRYSLKDINKVLKSVSGKENDKI